MRSRFVLPAALFAAAGVVGWMVASGGRLVPAQDAKVKSPDTAAPGRGRLGPSVPADAVGLHRRADDEGLRPQEARRTPAAGRRCAQRPHHHDGRRRAGHPVDLRRRDQHADAQPRGEDGRLVQPLPLHGHVLAHAVGTAVRAEPYPRRQRPDRRAGQRLGRVQRHHPEVRGDRGRGAEVLRVQHRRVGQVAQHAGRTDHLQGAVRLLADRVRVRVLLRLPRRRGVAVRAAPGAEHGAGEPARAAPQGLPPHRGHRRGRHPVAPRAAGVRPGQAVPDVLGTRRVPRPAPRHEGVGGQVQGEVRRRLGQVPRAGFRPPEATRLDPAERQAHAPPRHAPVLGLDPRGGEAVPAAADGGVRGVHRARRPQRRPGHRRDREAGPARQHADLLHLGRQRLVGRGAERVDQRTDRPEWHPVYGRAAHQGARRPRRAGRPGVAEDRQHVPRRLGVGGEHAVQVHQGRRRALRRHPAADGRGLAPGHQAGRRPRGRSSTTSSTSCRRSTR